METWTSLSTYQSMDLWRSSDQWNFSSGPSYIGPSASLNTSCGYFPSSRMHKKIDILSNWQNPHIGPLTCRVKVVNIGRDKWKPLELLLSYKNISQNNTTFLEGLQRLALLSRTWKLQRLWYPPHPFSTHLFDRRQLDLGEWQWIFINLILWWFQLHCYSRCGFIAWATQHIS